MDEQRVQRRKTMRGNTWTGLLFLLVGIVLLMNQMGFPFPSWLFGWEMIVITIGFFIGVHNRFRDFTWLVMVVVGLVFLSDNIWPEIRLRQFAWPMIIMGVGLLFLFSPRSMCNGSKRRFGGGCRGRSARGEVTVSSDTETSRDSVLDIISIFSGVKKRILSKQFAGGDIVCVFGGAEVNLTNADFDSTVVLELVQIFGGTKLVIPANWEVRSEVAAIFGGVDDKRPQPGVSVPEKTIILNGTVIFGGVEVRSY